MSDYPNPKTAMEQQDLITDHKNERDKAWKRKTYRIPVILTE